MKKVILESHVPYTGDVLGRVAEVVVLPPEEITQSTVSDADALIVRTRTRCDEALLGHSKVSFVGTATIGTDHFDLPWLAAHGIEAVNAPGCNAPAVAQYVLASILTYIPDPKGLTVGVVGVGHVGSIVDDWCRSLGMNTLLCDPPRAAAEGSEKFTSMQEIAEKADIITFHTPYYRPGHPYATHHLADDAFFALLKRKPMVINAARGPVVDNEALLRAMDAGRVSRTVIDCWEGEPRINLTLLHRVDIATPHIAGYSVEGKKRAAQTVVNALMRHFGCDLRLDNNVAAGAVANPHPEAISSSYDPLTDTAAMRRAFAADPSAATFERLRNTYPLRAEVQ